MQPHRCPNKMNLGLVDFLSYNVCALLLIIFSIKYLYINCMISAQIKKGNTFLINSLEDYLLQSVVLPDNRALKTVKLNYYNFIECMA